MIQDADLEYDLDDYDGLLAPLVHWQSMFVLGSRHHGDWKMRRFNDQPITGVIMNSGHSFFRSLINIALRTSIADPFTMFKVFRRDALYGLEFTCNRFDFDIELLMKLVRKGYVPLELPVNYDFAVLCRGEEGQRDARRVDLDLDHPQGTIFFDRAPYVIGTGQGASPAGSPPQ